MKKIVCLYVCMFVCLYVGSASAAVLTLNDTTGTTIGSSLDFDGLTITLSGGGIDGGAPFADGSVVYNSNSSAYPTANDIVFAFDNIVDNVAFSFEPWGVTGSGRGNLWVEVFLGSASLGLQEITIGSFHTESLFSFGEMTSFVVNNGCNTASGDSSCSWISRYSEVSYDTVPVPVPEPTSLALLGLGLAGLGFSRKKKNA